MNPFRTRVPFLSLKPLLALLLVLGAWPCMAQSAPRSDDDDVDRRVVRKVDRVVDRNVDIDHDDWMPVMPCEEVESDHPEAVRRSRRGYLGVELTPLTEELLRHFGVAGDGVMVSKINAGSPAETSGLRVGDIVSRFDGRTIDSTLDLGRAVRDLPGRAAVAEVWRDGKMQQLSVQVGERAMCSLDIGALMDDFDFTFDADSLGIDAEALARMAAKLSAQGTEMGLRVADEVARAMSEIDWEKQAEAMEVLTEIDEARMEALQRRLEELERRMESEYKRFGEQYERELEQAMRQKERALRDQEQALRERMEAQTQERRERLEETRAQAEARRAEVEQRAAEARERMEAQRQAEEEDDGGGTIDV